VSSTTIFYDSPDDDPRRYRLTPESFAPPTNELGICVPLSVVVGRSDRGVVAIEHATAYSTGVTFDFVAVAQRLTERETLRLIHEQPLNADAKRVPAEFIRMSLELADGSRVSNVEAFPGHPKAPLLMLHGGSGGSVTSGRMELRRSYWLWPLPPAGPLTVSVEWPALDLLRSSTELSGELLREAGARSSSLWLTEA
jgi:hypothetical protein